MKFQTYSYLTLLNPNLAIMKFDRKNDKIVYITLILQDLYYTYTLQFTDELQLRWVPLSYITLYTLCWRLGKTWLSPSITVMKIPDNEIHLPNVTFGLHRHIRATVTVHFLLVAVVVPPFNFGETLVETEMKNKRCNGTYITFVRKPPSWNYEITV